MLCYAAELHRAADQEAHALVGREAIDHELVAVEALALERACNRQTLQDGREVQGRAQRPVG